MYNFLSLVNDVNNKMNEVPLTSVTFNTASGFYSDSKNSVNYAVDKINSVAWEWPFNQVTETLPLTIDQVRYSLPVNSKSVNWKTFRIVGDDNLNVSTTSLWSMDYEDYLTKYSDMEYRPSKYHNLPEVVVRTPDRKFAVLPPPDKAYTLVYEYCTLPTTLSNWDDIPSIPEFFRSVINDGSFAQAFRFRGDMELSESYQQRFEDGIKNMRTLFINRTDYISSTQIIRR